MTKARRISDATWTAFTECIRFIVVPTVLVSLITTSYPDLKTAFTPDLEAYIIFFGFMIVAASTLEAINRPGTHKRLLFGLTCIAFICLWTFVIFGGGEASFSYGPYSVRFDMSKIVYIILVGLSLKGLLVIQTFYDFRAQAQEEDRKHELEEREAAKPLVTRQRTPRISVPGFAAFSRLSFQVTPDDSVGYVPPPPPPRDEPEFKECPVCGVKASMYERTCKHCGAWFKGPFA